MGRLSDLAGQTVYLDANIFIYFVEAYAPTAHIVRPLFQMISSGALTAVTSELTIAEVLVKPLRDRNTLVVDAYRALLSGTNDINLAPITRQSLSQAAAIRAVGSIKLPDAIHAATALQLSNCEFITNDQGFASVAGLSVQIVASLTV